MNHLHTNPSLHYHIEKEDKAFVDIILATHPYFIDSLSLFSRLKRL